jgi:hypothetical protein
MKFMKSAQRWACLLVLLFAAGCTTYYRVTDQSSRRAYYTTDIDRRDSGAVQFYDVQSRANVTLQSSEIIEISREVLTPASKSRFYVKR